MERFKYLFFRCLVWVIPPRFVGNDGLVGNVAGYVYSSFYVYSQALGQGRWW